MGSIHIGFTMRVQKHILVENKTRHENYCIMNIEGWIDSGRNWAVVKVDRETGKYYRSLYKSFSGIKLQRPSHQEHVTFISPHDDLRIPVLKGKVSIEIIHEPATNGNAVWYPVRCDYLLSVREYLQLGELYIPLHFCIGYHKEGSIFENTPEIEPKT